MLSDQTKTDAFTEFVADSESRLRRALTGALGPDLAREAAAEAFAYGWEHWERISEMDNPVGYLYRVASNFGKRTRRRPVVLPTAPLERLPWVEPELPHALARLPERQRVVVYLVHGHEWTLREVAELIGVSKGTAQKHLNRGMRRLKRQMGVDE